MSKKFIDLTGWNDPTEVMVGSSFGSTITFRRWCELTAKEINETAENMPAVVETRIDGFIRMVRKEKKAGEV